MKNILTKIKNNELIKVSGKNSIQIVVQFIVGLLKIKIASIWLGPSGMALLSQFNNFIQLTGNIANGGISNGVTKLARHGHSKKQLGIIISTSLITTTIASLITGVIVFLFAEILTLKLLHDVSYKLIIQFSGLFIFFSALTNLTLALLKGLRNYKAFIIANIFIALTSFLTMLPAIYLWGIKGALCAILFTFLLTGVFCLCFLNISWRLPRFSKKVGTRLFSFSTMLIVAAIIGPLTQIIVRNIIIEHCSLEEAGWWDGVKRISTNYLSILTSTVSLYVVPKISRLSLHVDLKNEIINYLKTFIPLVIVASGVIYFSRFIIIKVLFSKEFSQMESLFLFQCIGDVLKMIGWLFSIVLIMQEKVKTYILSEVLMGLAIVSTAYFIIPIVGISGSTLCYMINNIIYCILIILLYRYSIKKTELI